MYFECAEFFLGCWSDEAVSHVRYRGANHQACHVGDRHRIPWREMERETEREQ